MAHYVCTGGCNGVSDTPGVCQTNDCSKYQQELVECSCDDGLHDGMMDAGDMAEEEDV